MPEGLQPRMSFKRTRATWKSSGRVSPRGQYTVGESKKQCEILKHWPGEGIRIPKITVHKIHTHTHIHVCIMINTAPEFLVKLRTGRVTGCELPRSGGKWGSDPGQSGESQCGWLWLLILSLTLVPNHRKSFGTLNPGACWGMFFCL